MRESVIISDLTHMGGDRVCIAGYLDLHNEICIRPIYKHGGITKDWLSKDNNVVIRPFNKVEFDFDLGDKKNLVKPHTEDRDLLSEYCEFKGRLSVAEQISFLERIDDKCVNNIFNAKILRGPGWYIRRGEGERSLGTISNPLNLETIFSMGSNKFDYRISFSDQSGDRYNLAVTDLSFRYFLDYLTFHRNMNNKYAAQLVTEKLRNADTVFVRIGLTRGTWQAHPGKCFLQVNGIYSFPDYLDGGSFRSYEINNGELAKKRQMCNLRYDDVDRKLNQIRNNEKTIEFSNLRSFDKIRVKYPKSYKCWSDEDDNILIRLLRSGKSIYEIADQLQKQPNAIRSRANKLNINTDSIFEMTCLDKNKRLDEFDYYVEIETILEKAYMVHSQITELKRRINVLENKYKFYVNEANVHEIIQQGVYKLELITRKRRKVNSAAFRELYPDIFVKIASISVQAGEKEVGRDAMEDLVTYAVSKSYVVTKIDKESDSKLINSSKE